ncbi:DUF3566 domain-containing protein [bacterium]|nr:DUF3566 domain-containing protein [bacterium]
MFKNQTIELNRIPVWPVAKVIFIVSSIIYFAYFLLFFSVIAKMFSSFTSNLDPVLDESFSQIGTFGGIAVFFVSLFISGVIGFISTVFSVIGVIAYNIVSSFVGPVKFEISSDLLLAQTQNHSLDEGAILQIVRKEINQKEQERAKPQTKTYTETDFMPQQEKKEEQNNDENPVS